MPDPRRNQKKIIITAVIIGLLLAAAGALLIQKEKSGQETSGGKESSGESIYRPSETGPEGEETTVEPVPEQINSESTAGAGDGAETDAVQSPGFAERFREAVTVTEEEDYRPAADLTELSGSYPDVTGWLSIPGTGIEDAVFRSPTDDTLYLDHDRDKKGSSAGELFIESRYNSADFADPVTVVYGHNMRSGKKFGPLEEYYTGAVDGLASGEAAGKYGIITVTVPEGELTYQVFAAIPFDDRHILASYDFGSPLASGRFFSEVRKTRVLGGFVDRSVVIGERDKVLILSTCTADHQSRFLVMARLVGARTERK